MREARAVFGELPAFEPGHYTFLATYAQGANGDGMEHRNSTVLTAPAALAQAERPLLGTVAHEFFHAWNVERIRPRSLEPFNFDDANVSSELWVAEGFTQYYGALLMARAGLSTRDDALRSVGGLINAVNASAGRRVRFAPEMSRLAPFVDAACSVDPTNWGNTYLSYYTFGAAIALGLDLELRDRTDGKVTLDDYMKALWTKYGKTPSAPGTVATPYTAADLQTTLAEVSGSVSFAREFFERYVDGPELVEYGMLLKRMGLIWKPLYPGRAWMGDLPMTSGTDGARITNAAPMGTPAYDAGFGEGDVLVSIGGKDVRSASDVAAIVEAAKPGDRLEATYLRHGKPRQATIALRGTSDADAGDARERRRDADARGTEDARRLARLAGEVDCGRSFRVGKGRFEAFSDGVLAIIITIMVLELKVPHGADWHAIQPLLPRVPQLRPELHLHRHLLEQPPPHAARDDARLGRGDVGQPAPAVLAVAGAVRHRLDGREPLRARCRPRPTAWCC